MQMLDDFKSTLHLVRIVTHFSNPTRIEGIYFLQCIWKGFSAIKYLIMGSIMYITV